jgi:hypothetical protein
VTGLLPLAGEPVACDAAVIRGEHFRVTVLTEALIRVEWSDTGVFEDRASTFAVQRALPVPEFQVRRAGGRLELWTDFLHLDYDGGPFSPSGLVVTVRGEVQGSHTSVWRYGERASGLGGTARTLDDADGAVPLGGGVVSTSGLAVIDDSASFVFEADGRPACRKHGTRDLYIFARGKDYLGAVRDLYAVSGPVPVLPRWALGNWSPGLPSRVA